MVTLHAYVLRELLKTFGLTVTALTVLLTMGGGLFNLLRYEGLSGADLLHVLPLLLPIFLALAMPLAALFAATIVYGRLAADNELLACRAAGVNVHRLFLSAILLAVFVAFVTLLLVNFMIPDFATRLYRYARTNLRNIAAQQLRLKGYVRYEKGHQYFMTGRDVATDFAAGKLAAKGFDPDLDYLLVTAPTFLELDASGQIVRFTTARAGLCQFDKRRTPMTITLYLRDGQDFELGRGAARIRQQTIGPIELPDIEALPRKPSMADVRTLKRWQREPWQADALREDFVKFYRSLLSQRFLEAAAQVLSEGGTFTLLDAEERRCDLTARQTVLSDARLRLVDASVAVHRPEQPLPLKYLAPEAELIPRAASLGDLSVELSLRPGLDQPLLEFNPRSTDYHSGREKPALSLDGLLIPEGVHREVAAFAPAMVLDPGVPLPLAAEPSEKLAKDRAELQRRAGENQRKVTGHLHFRLSFATSALVTVLMGAALGVIFRGGQALAAFGLAFIPFGTVLVLSLMGRQLCEKAGTEAIGPLVVWGGLVLAGVADVLILRLGVRR